MQNAKETMQASTHFPNKLECVSAKQRWQGQDGKNEQARDLICITCALIGPTERPYRFPRLRYTAASNVGLALLYLYLGALEFGLFLGSRRGDMWELQYCRCRA
jgi:hypothetical protein